MQDECTLTHFGHFCSVRLLALPVVSKGVEGSASSSTDVAEVVTRATNSSSDVAGVVIRAADMFSDPEGVTIKTAQFPLQVICALGPQKHHGH